MLANAGMDLEEQEAPGFATFAVIMQDRTKEDIIEALEQAELESVAGHEDGSEPDRD